MRQGEQHVNILPNTNLPQNIPLVQYQPPHNFTIKDQHLLKPPPVLGAGKTIYFGCFPCSVLFSDSKFYIVVLFSFSFIGLKAIVDLG